MRLTILTILLAAVLVTATIPMIKANLQSDLKEFAALIPRRRIGFIAARHFVLDSQFRTALSFVRSSEFAETWRQVRETSEFLDIVDYVTYSGTIYDVTHVIDNVPNRLRAFKIPAKVPVDMMFPRNLSSFLREVLRALPKSKISSLMARKVQDGGDFAKVYEALQKMEFRKLIDNARNSDNLSAPIRTLAQNYINIDEIIESAFSVLKWGP